MIRLLATPRWLGYLALTIIFAIVASFFGLWQWDRREQAVASIDILDAHWDLDPRPLDEVLGSPPAFTPAQEWVPVLVSGQYLPEDQLLVRTRPRGGQVGFEVLVPMLTQDGRYIVVNRGWIPTGETRDYPDLVPAPPAGVVNIVARLKPSEPTLPGRGAPEGQIPSIDLGSINAGVSYSLPTDFYLLLAQESPAIAPAPLTGVRPQLDEGPHLSYSFQWFVFGILAFIGLIVLLRQEAHREAGIEPPKRSTPSDAEEEDALLERADR